MKMLMEHFEQFIQELNDAPGYVKENLMCYFWHNTGACSNCPKDECPGREPRKASEKLLTGRLIDGEVYAPYSEAIRIVKETNERFDKVFTVMKAKILKLERDCEILRLRADNWKSLCLTKGNNDSD